MNRIQNRFRKSTISIFSEKDGWYWRAFDRAEDQLGFWAQGGPFATQTDALESALGIPHPTSEPSHE